MSVFIPHKMRSVQKQTVRCCQWCGKHAKSKQMFKLRDGPIDWWFCDDSHAVEWLDVRCSCVKVNEMLKQCPRDRDLGMKTIDEWVRDTLSQHRANAITADR
jgi:hypothetical protein